MTAALKLLERVEPEKVGRYGNANRTYYLDLSRIEQSLREDNDFAIAWGELSDGLQRGVVRGLIHELRESERRIVELELRESIAQSRAERFRMESERMKQRLEAKESE